MVERLGQGQRGLCGWDNLGNPATRTDGNGIATTYAYVDPESRLSKITYPTGTLPNVTVGYDGYGRLSTLNNGTTVTNAGYTNGGTTYPGYDDDDALNVQTTFLASDHATTLFNAALAYAYNPDGSRASLGTPAGNFTYGYDNDDRLSTLTNPFSEQSSWLYDNDSRLQSQTLGNGIVSSYAYNARSFLTDLLNKGGSTTLSEFGGSTPSTAMTYDALGDVTSVKANVPAAPGSYSGTTNYQYDAKTELTQEASTRSGGYTNADSYDLAENPTQVRGVAQPTANADNQLPVSGVTFDGNGNPSKVEGLTSSFDIENRATSLGSVSSTWGGNGLRASKGGTYFLYDGSVPVCELSSTGSVMATNTFGGAGLISRHISNGSTFYTFDALGSVTQRYTSTGSLVSSDLYDAFGKGTSTGGGDVFAYEGQFGYYTDTTTGLILCGHRFYDSTAGRFINRDPIGYAGGINLYGYTGNNPTNWMDPSGLDGVINKIVGPIFSQNPTAVTGLAAAGSAGYLATYNPSGGAINGGLGIAAGGTSMVAGGAYAAGGFAALQGGMSAGIGVGGLGGALGGSGAVAAGLGGIAAGGAAIALGAVAAGAGGWQVGTDLVNQPWGPGGSTVGDTDANALAPLFTDPSNQPSVPPGIYGPNGSNPIYGPNGSNPIFGPNGSNPIFGPDGPTEPHGTSPNSSGPCL